MLKENRNSSIALALMFAAFRWVQSPEGSCIVAICRTDLIKMFHKGGLKPLNLSVQTGKVKYELSIAYIDELEMMVQNKIRI